MLKDTYVKTYLASVVDTQLLKLVKFRYSIFKSWLCNFLHMKNSKIFFPYGSAQDFIRIWYIVLFFDYSNIVPLILHSEPKNQVYSYCCESALQTSPMSLSVFLVRADCLSKNIPSLFALRCLVESILDPKSSDLFLIRPLYKLIYKMSMSSKSILRVWASFHIVSVILKDALLE